MKKLFIVILTMAFAVATFTAFGCKNKHPGRTSSAHVHDYGEWKRLRLKKMDSKSVFVKVATKGKHA